MKTPLALIALAYAAGLIAGHYVAIPIAAAFACCFAVVLAAVWIRAARTVLLIKALFLFGLLNLNLRTELISPHDLRTLAGNREQLVTIRGKLREKPGQRVYQRDDRETWRTIAQVRVEQIQLDNGEFSPAHGDVLSITSGVLTNFASGDRVEVSGVLLLPPTPLAEGLFDYRTYLAQRGIYHQLKIESPNEWKSAGINNTPPLTARFSRWAQHALERGLPEQDSPLRLQWAMLLGWQTALTSEVSEPFMRSGTMHIFAISGLHIAVIAGIFVVLLRAIVVPRFVCGIIIVPLIWFYTAATGWQPSAIRSAVMMTIIIFGWSLKRPQNLVNSLAAAALIILIWDPQQLFQASFQLSFFVVLSIALLVPMLDQWKARVFKLDPLLPMQLRPRWQRWAVNVGNTLWKCFATSLAAFLGSAPLIAYYFHLFTLGSLLANLVIVPVSSLALMSGVGSMLTSAWLPFAADWFNNAGWFFMRAMMWLSERATEIPLSWFHTRPPGPVEFAFYYLALLALLGGWLKRERWRWIIGGVLTALLAVSATQFFIARGRAELVVLPLNGTHAVFAREAGNSRSWLVNCGEDSSFSFVLKPFLQARGMNRLGQLVLAHGDTRHAGAMLEVNKLFHPRVVEMTPQPSRSARFRELISDLDLDSSIKPGATNGAQLGPWRVLHPAADDRFTRGEDGAVVMMGTFENVRVLLLNDLSLAGQNALLARHPSLRADVVVTGLPDRGEALPQEIIERVQPRLIIVADAEFPVAKRANEELRARLRRTGIPAVFTREAGAVTLTMKNGAYQARGARAQRD
jgi:competence protein ComEC